MTTRSAAPVRGPSPGEAEVAAPGGRDSGKAVSSKSFLTWSRLGSHRGTRRRACTGEDHRRGEAGRRKGLRRHRRLGYATPERAVGAWECVGRTCLLWVVEQPNATMSFMLPGMPASVPPTLRPLATETQPRSTTNTPASNYAGREHRAGVRCSALCGSRKERQTEALPTRRPQTRRWDQG